MPMMRAAIFAGLLAAGALAAPAAEADWRHRGHGSGVVGGALLGPGVRAAIGALLAPPVIYAPPPGMYYTPPPPPAHGFWEPPPGPYDVQPKPAYGPPPGWGWVK